MRILVFGDSIAYGAWDSEGGWVDRLKRWAHQHYVDEGVKIQVLNLGVGGNTSAGVAARIGAEVQSRHSVNWPLTVLCMIGSNDGRIKNGKTEVSPQEFAENVKSIIRQAQAYTHRIIFVGLPKIAQDELDFKETHYSQVVIGEYDKKLQEITASEGVGYVDVRSSFDESTMLFRDGLHPNDAGHQLIFQAVKETIAPHLVAPETRKL